MKRRKFILGTGAAATSGATLLGSGAFSSVEAERSVTVDVVGDANAFLRLAPCEGSPNGDYVTNASEGAMAIELSDEENVSGSGVNPEALSVFHNVFEIRNQGTQEICVDFEIDVEPIPDDADVPNRYDFESGHPAVAFYRGADRTAYVAPDTLDTDRVGAIQLDVGESECIGFEVRAFGFETTTDLFAETSMVIRADADANCEESRTDPEPAPNLPDRLFHWRMDEGAGDEVLDSGDLGLAKDGERVPDGEEGPDWVQGEWVGNYALDADGAEQYVQTPKWDDVDDFDLNDDFAIAYTIESTDDADNANVLGARDGTDGDDPGLVVTYNNQWMGLEKGAGFILNDEDDDGGDVIYTENVQTEGEPTRFVINKKGADPGNWEIFKNGKEVDIEVKNDAAGDDLPDLPREPRLFGSGVEDRRLEGILDDVVIYDEPLDVEDEIDADLARQPWSSE